jgi:hypothetical protein
MIITIARANNYLPDILEKMDEEESESNSS